MPRFITTVMLNLLYAHVYCIIFESILDNLCFFIFKVYLTIFSIYFSIAIHNKDSLIGTPPIETCTYLITIIHNCNNYDIGTFQIPIECDQCNYF